LNIPQFRSDEKLNTNRRDDCLLHPHAESEQNNKSFGVEELRRIPQRKKASTDRMNSGFCWPIPNPKRKELQAALEPRILIINADDMGYARGINEAIIRCAAQGVLRSTTLMANGEAFEHAVSLLRSAENLRAGVHLVLTDLKPLAKPWDLGGLVTEEGRLPRGLSGLISAMVRRGVSQDAIRRELSLQVEKVLDHGIRPTHLDSHKHIHAIPCVRDAAIHVAHRYGIPWIRNPFETSGGAPEIPAGFKPRRLYSVLNQWGDAAIARVLSPNFKRSIHRAGLRTPHRFYGTALMGRWDLQTVHRVFRTLPPGVNEWMVHPGNVDEDLIRMGSSLLAERERERDLLLSPGLQRFLSDQSILCRSFGDELS
jgi:predicted glycoside hydrolase/deacetylase ChbG (UPF0249 family)